MKKFFYFLLILFLLTTNCFAVINEYTGPGSKFIEIKDQPVNSGSFVQWTFTGVSKLNSIDFNETNITTASVKFMLPSGTVGKTEELTSGIPIPNSGFDIVEVRISNTQGVSATFNGNVRLYIGSNISTSNPLSVQAIVDGDPVSKDNPSHSQPTDHTGRVGLMSVFGEQITGKRIAKITGQFKYPIPSDSADAVIVGSGTITNNDAMLTVSTGISVNGTAKISTRESLRYIPGYDTYLNWTAVHTGSFVTSNGITTGVEDSYQRSGLYDDSDGFFIGFEGETFGFTRRRLGVDNFTTINLTEFKENEGYGLDLTKGNIFRLDYGYLGFAAVVVDVMEPGGNWASLFKLEYPNSATETHITQTFLEPRIEVVNTGNTTNVVLKIGSFCAGIIDGGGQTPGTRDFGDSFSFGPVSGTQDLIAYRVTDNFYGFDNKVPVEFSWFDAAVEGNKPFQIYFTINPSVITPGTWTPRSIDSVMEYSTDTVWDTDGELLLPFSLAKVGQINLSIKDQSVKLLPGDVLVIRFITTSTGYDAVTGFKWDELF